MASTTTTVIVPPGGSVRVRTLDRMAHHADEIDGVWAEDVGAADWVIVRTRNSVYTLAPTGEGRYRVSGGWFATRSADEQNVRIAGCTWGGAAIHTRVVAAVGMFLEFDNGVRTTRIQDVRLVKGRADRTH